ncbi:class I SAM-dependent methyltransferase [Ammoniphilus sp. CFH 90114]|uniref:class I SAM-dependent methyltransferase n=1 Tax=Ammoniphilus sp. CFH 90114 TaxID=2493665 RepID=UPI0013E9393D|nr:SAM-dependent methyltransferase [Ammoniphilus sp. CFH 90114]
MSLINLIKKKMDQSPRRSISYYEYMEMALYSPSLGYYAKEKIKVGKEGDFYTNSSVGDVYGQTLAHIIADMLSRLPESEPKYLVEFGGGDGRLMAQILSEWLETMPTFMREVQPIMIEKSEFHRGLQEKQLRDFPVLWVKGWDELIIQKGSINGVIFSNELLDAFPIYIAEWSRGKWHEVRVGWNEQRGELEEQIDEITDQAFLDYCHQEEVHIPKRDGYRLEMNRDAGRWLKEIAEGLKTGYLITVDYGFLRPELYIPQRNKGTVMCYHQHTATEDVLSLPGEKDITTHVNFSYLMEEGEKNGLKNLGFFTQSQFLINGGILSRLQSHQESDPFHGAVSKRNRAIKQLIMPGGMGDTFKVLVQSKGKVEREVLGVVQKGWV